MAVRLTPMAQMLLSAHRLSGDGTHIARLGMSGQAIGAAQPLIQKTLTFTVANSGPSGAYGLVVFHVGFGATPPDMFQVTMRSLGDYQCQDVLQLEDVANGHDTWVEMTGGVGYSIDVQNNDPEVWAAFEAKIYFLVLMTRQDWKDMEETVRRQAFIAPAQLSLGRAAAPAGVA